MPYDNDYSHSIDVSSCEWSALHNGKGAVTGFKGTFDRGQRARAIKMVGLLKGHYVGVEDFKMDASSQWVFYVKDAESMRRLMDLPGFPEALIEEVGQKGMATQNKQPSRSR